MKVLITGGAGFIGSNAALRFMQEDHRVVLFDNLSRQGSQANLRWLQEQGNPSFIKGDVRDFAALEEAFRAHPDIDVVLHLAAQVAVTTSVADPRLDFEINALGTLNVLEAVRQWAPQAILLFASTNKVYGAMDDLEVVEMDGRYQYGNLRGISEERPLDFHSPYGCSKGAADQYVRDYARIYSLRTVVFRQSCTYGYRQFGVEDQGWVAWFAIAALLGRPITIYGDGKQVRDLLFVDDLLAAYQRAIQNIEVACGQVYNMGGGPSNQASLLEVLSQLERHLGRPIPRSFSSWRPGDQKVCVMDTSLAQRELGWQPRVGVEEGVGRLFHWVVENKRLF